MKTYTELELEVIRFDATDIIVTSNISKEPDEGSDTKEDDDVIVKNNNVGADSPFGFGLGDFGGAMVDVTEEVTFDTEG